jgi:UDP-N-acetylglucosamine--N-acetylmuramyl-(pentapeptide) pyrophosphoryl-undecaprenol N-acetylglucosamine transferase
VTGAAEAGEAERLRGTLEPELAARYEPAGYRDDMPVLMLAADLAVARAGASVLGELPAASLPAILVPGTFAGGHQRDNAAWLREAGAAEVVEESDIAGLAALILELLADAARLGQMKSAAARLARPDAAADIARMVVEAARR